MPASIRRVGDDVSVSVSPERLVKKAEPAKASETEGSFEGEVASKEPSAEESAPEKSSGCVAS